MRVAVGLRLGTPHSCYHCGTDVDGKGIHGMSCRKSEGYHHRHSELNDIVHRALTTAHVPSGFEPASVLRKDRKRPDGISVVPWQSGKLLVSDATCSDTFAHLYVTILQVLLDWLAVAEGRKRMKYSNLA